MLSAIVAIGKNNVIGKNGDLIWRISEDLKRFKELTMGKTIIMGRKTFQSLPGVLPGRDHIVLTRNNNFNVEDERVKVITNVAQLEPYIKDSKEHFIIGGAEIYKILLDNTKKLYITEVDKEEDGDTFFSEIDKEEWKIVSQSEVKYDRLNDINYKYMDYIRK